MYMPGNRIPLQFFEGVELLFSRNGKTNADQWLWSMELALRSCLLFDIVSGAISKELLPEETWLHDAEPDRMTQVEDPENFTSPSPPAEPVPKSSSCMTTRMIAEEPAAAATATDEEVTSIGHHQKLALRSSSSVAYRFAALSSNHVCHCAVT